MALHGWQNTILLLFCRGITIRMPHDTIRIENFGCDMILFDMIHICTLKSYRLINKRPKGPHIVHLSTMCHLFEESAREAIFVFWSAWKTQTWWKTLRSCFLSSFVEFRSEVSEEKSKMSPPFRGQGSHVVFPIGPKKHKLGKGRWDLASCQVSLNSVQRFQRRSWKCLSQSDARAAILFFRSARKTQTW